MELTCAACGEPFDAKSRRFKFCARPECKRQRARGRKRGERAVGEVIDLPPPPARVSVTSATRAQLEKVGRAETAEGQNAIVLAERLDAATYNALETGSSVAALSKQHLAALADALKDVSVNADGVDELKLRRERRGA
jgi:hypothetical protein